MIKKIIFWILLGLVVGSCSSDESTDTSLGTIFIGIFDNDWEVQGVDNYSIGIFRDGPEDTSSGILRGEENHPQEGSTAMTNGTFDGLDIEFTIPRNGGNENVVFSGKMTPTSETDHNIIRIDLTTSDGKNLVLEKL